MIKRLVRQRNLVLNLFDTWIKIPRAFQKHKWADIVTTNYNNGLFPENYRVHSMIIILLV